MARISALVLTHNNESLLPACLASLEWVDEIIAVDDHSTDASREIAERAGARLFTRTLETFSEQRNYGLAQCTGDWVIVLDADEEITPELRQEILATFQQEPTVAAFRMPRKNIFLGQWIRGCGWYPDRALRIFKRAGVYYTGIVHEALHVSGVIGTLHHPIRHLSFTSIEQYLEKCNRYTTMAAEQLFRDGKRATIADILLLPPLTFLKDYLLRKGIRDGAAGLVVCILSSYYVFLKFVKLSYLGRNR